MGWPKKEKEKEAIPPRDGPPPDKPELVDPVSRRDLVKLMEKLWKPYKDESDVVKVEVQQCQKFLNLVYTIYRKYGSRKQKRLLDDLFSEERLPNSDEKRSDWVRDVGSKIIGEPDLRDELKLSPMLTLVCKLAWLKDLEEAVGKGKLKNQWSLLPQEFEYFRSILSHHLDDPAIWPLKEKCCGESMWEPRSIRTGLDRHQEPLEFSLAARTAFVARAFTLLMMDRAFQKRVMKSLRK